jgi:hypothetical protein
MSLTGHIWQNSTSGEVVAGQGSVRGAGWYLQFEGTIPGVGGSILSATTGALGIQTHTPGLFMLVPFLQRS